MATIMACDRCGKQTPKDMARNGWYHLSKSGDPTADRSMWDFCTAKCLANWASEKAETERRPKRDRVPVGDLAFGDDFVGLVENG